MKIVSYNVNGIRAAIRKGLVEWINDNDFDIICIQETKASLEQVDMTPFEQLGYQHYWHSAQKKGYSGVLTLTKQTPSFTQAGMGIEKYDDEGRLLRTDFDDWTLINTYFPSGTRGGVRQEFKYAFLDDIFEWITQLKTTRSNIILVGDYNIAHQEIDIHNPKSNKKTSGFLPEERAWMSKWFDSGFIDAFRYKYPETVSYSWWSYRSNAREQNKGWRLDYQSVTDTLKDKINEVQQLKNAMHSDHCPVFLDINF